MKILKLIDIQKGLFKEIEDLAIKRGSSYSGYKDTFAALRIPSQIGLTADPQTTCLVMIALKLARLKNLHASMNTEKKAKRDTVLDLVNYTTYYLALEEENDYKS